MTVSTIFVDRSKAADETRGPVLPCQLEADLDLWWRYDQESLSRQRELCAKCPVRQACLELALCTDSVGVWGGTTDAERKAMARGCAHGDAA